jgi:hypothetical protein
MSSQRSADEVPLEATTRSETKRARLGNDEEEVGDFITVSSRMSQTEVEDEHLNSISTSGAASQGTDGDFQKSHRMSTGYSNAVATARGALLALDTNSTEFDAQGRNLAQDPDLSHDNIPSHSNIEPIRASLSSSSCDGESRPSRELPNHSTLANSEQDRQNATTLLALQTERTTSRPARFQKADSPSQSTAATESASRPVVFRLSATSSIAQSGPSVSSNDLSPHPDGLPRLETSSSGILRTIPGSPDLKPFQPTTQSTENPAALQTPNQRSPQNGDARSQPLPSQSMHPASTLIYNRHDTSNTECAYNQTGSGKMYALSSNATMAVADSIDSEQAPSPRQRSSQQLRISRSDDICKASIRGESADLNPSQPFASTKKTGMEREHQLRPGAYPQSRAARSPQSDIPRQSADTQTRHLRQRPTYPPSAPLHQPGISIGPRNNQSSAVKFTADNRFESPLLSVDVRSLFEIFTSHAQLLLRSKEPLPRDIFYPVGMLVWQNSLDFQKWYMAVSGTADVPFFRFELLDVHWQPEKAFLVPRDNPHYFLALKQYVWDLFWIASHLNGAPAAFKILIDAADPQPSAAGARRVAHGSPPRNGAPLEHFAAPQSHPSRLDNTGTVTRQTRFPGVDTSHLSRQQAHLGETLDPRAPYSQPSATVPQPQIIIRLQADESGKFSAPYNKSFMRPKITATEFFAWFASRTGRGGSSGPPSLIFTFKDAMPGPKSSRITQTNDDHFNLMRKDLAAQVEKARKYMSNLTEFCVLVTDPGWVSTDMEEDEDW